jgi:peptidoglycan/LPS O-acetylase OafA/YrhL
LRYGGAFALPLIFFVFGNHPIDRIIGEFSYPIYLVHFFVLQATTNALHLIKVNSLHPASVICAIVSIVISSALYRFLIVPLDRKRHALTIHSVRKQHEADLPSPLA